MLVALGSPALADDAGFEFVPAATRGSLEVSLCVPPSVKAAGKLYVRLTNASMVRDVAVPPETLNHGVAAVVLPALTAGTYSALLYDESGQVLRVGKTLRILPSEAPSIAKIEPQASYRIGEAYSFEVIGENFSEEAVDNKVRINGAEIQFASTITDAAYRLSVEACKGQYPCLIGSRRALRVYGLDGARFSSPISVTVEVAPLLSGPHALLLSPVSRAMPIWLAVVAVLGLGGVTCLVTWKKASEYQPIALAATPNGKKRKAYRTLAYLIIDHETNTYSLSKVQLLLWTGAAVLTYVYLAASQALVQWKWGIPPVPDGLPTLMGVSAGTAAFATGATDLRGTKGAGAPHPEFADLVTSGGVFAPERLQFLVWTLLGVFCFVAATLAQDPATVVGLPKIPDNFLPLMGVSSLGYLAGKVVRKPGPVLKGYTPNPLPVGTTSIVITGENLSPGAQVYVDGKLVPTSSVHPGAQPPGSEFVNELKVDLVPPASSTAFKVKIVNSDGQSAEL